MSSMKKSNDNAPAPKVMNPQDSVWSVEREV
jgi:hypothetical protein